MSLHASLFPNRLFTRNNFSIVVVFSIVIGSSYLYFRVRVRSNFLWSHVISRTTAISFFSENCPIDLSRNFFHISSTRSQSSITSRCSLITSERGIKYSRCSPFPFNGTPILRQNRSCGSKKNHARALSAQLIPPRTRGNFPHPVHRAIAGVS